MKRKPNLRKAAEGRECTIRIPGICNFTEQLIVMILLLSQLFAGEIKLKNISVGRLFQNAMLQLQNLKRLALLALVIYLKQ